MGCHCINAWKQAQKLFMDVINLHSRRGQKEEEEEEEEATGVQSTKLQNSFFGAASLRPAGHSNVQLGPGPEHNTLLSERR